MVADGVAVLHAAGQHDAAGLKAAVRVVREARAGLGRRHAQLVQHEEGVQVAQARRAQRAADAHARPCEAQMTDTKGDLQAGHSVDVSWATSMHMSKMRGRAPGMLIT